MMNNLIAASCFILLVIISVWGWGVLDWIWFRPKKLEKLLNQQGLKGNSYRLLVGDLKDESALIKEARSKPINLTDDIVPRVLPLAYSTISKYGKNSFSWYGQIPSVYITDPQLAREVMIKFDKFQKYFKTNNPLIKFVTEGVVTYEGEKWSKHRGILSPAFQLEKIKHMLPAFHTSASDMMSKWDKMVSTEGSGEIDIWPHLETLSADAISRTAFGHSYLQGRKIFNLQREQAKLCMEAMRSIYIPGSRFLPTRRNTRMKQIEREVRDLIMHMISERIKAMKEEAIRDDMLSILLKSNFEQGKNSGMSMQDIITECKLFYFVGQETTSTLLLWTMILLSKHPNWQAQAREEVLKVFGNEKPNYDGISRLKVVNMILNEVLRLYPPVIELTRIVVKETKLGELTIPAGVQLMILAILVHHDPEIWGEDAKEFKPERFSEGVSKATKNQFAYFPFGWGPRICIGQNFALLEVKMALSMILQHFSFELSPSYAHAPYTVFTLQPQFGAHLVLHKLQS